MAKTTICDACGIDCTGKSSVCNIRHDLVEGKHPLGVHAEFFGPNRQMVPAHNMRDASLDLCPVCQNKIEQAKWNEIAKIRGEKTRDTTDTTVRRERF